MTKTLASPISDAQSQGAMEYVGLGCCKDAPVRPPIQNIDRGSCENVCQSDNGCNGFSYGNLQKTLNSKPTQYCVLFMTCNTSTGGDGSCATALDGAWESFESWAKGKGAKCSSWNGKACGVGETANVGRGPGSCDSNNDCPCCAPFCSKYGYCQNYQ